MLLPEMWHNDYNWQVEEPTLWYFSSGGPAADGSTAPMLLAPEMLFHLPIVEWPIISVR